MKISEQRRKVIARSTVVVVICAMIGAFWHEFGFGHFGFFVSTVPFPAKDNQLKIFGELKPGPYAGEYRRVYLEGPNLQATTASTRESDPTQLYIGSERRPRGTIIALGGNLDFYIEKSTISRRSRPSYEVTLTRQVIADAEQLDRFESETPIRALWKETEMGVWKARIKGAPSKSGMLTILVPDKLLVNSTQPGAPELPIILSGPATPTGDKAFQLRSMCLDYSLARQRYYLLSSGGSPFDLDLAGDGAELVLRLEGDDPEKIARCAGGIWSKLPEPERKTRYHEQFGTEPFETILLAAPKIR